MTWPALALLALAQLAVVDGDTVDLGGERIRIMGLDTPELYSPRCIDEAREALAATDRLAELLAAGEVAIERRGTDRYGRTLAVVRVDGHDVAEIMIEEGHAREYHGSRRQSWCE